MVRTIVSALLLSTYIAAPATAQTQPSGNAQIVHDWADSVANELEIKIVDANDSCKLSGRSLLRWSNPIAGEVFGDCYVWTHDGSPVAFMSVYAFFTPEDKRRVTLQSLSQKPLVATRNGAVVWQPQSAGFDWLKLGDLPKPSPAPQRRRRQLSQIASKFSATIAESDASTAQRRLRFLTKPLFSYRSEAGEIGALFAFVDGTDPELLLRVETAGKAGFQVAAIRQNHRQLELQRNGQSVWEVEAIAPPFPNPQISDPKGVYYNTKWQTIVNVSGQTQP